PLQQPQHAGCVGNIADVDRLPTRPQQNDDVAIAGQTSLPFGFIRAIGTGSCGVKPRLHLHDNYPSVNVFARTLPDPSPLRLYLGSNSNPDATRAETSAMNSCRRPFGAAVKQILRPSRLHAG